MFDKLKKSAEDLKDKVAEAVDEHAPKISQGLDKAADFVDEKTGHKYSDKIDKATGAVKGGLDKVDGKADDFGTTPVTPVTPVTPPATPPVSDPPAGASY